MNTKLALFFFICLSLTTTAGAATVTSVLSSGDPDNRVDIAILSEGYTEAESGKYASDVNALIDSFFSKASVFVEYKSYFNVKRIFVASAESGASHLELTPTVVRNTAFGAYYGCQGIDRLICVDFNKVILAVDAALPINQRDYIMVLVNDPVFGGSGGYISVSSTNTEVVDVMLHEFGHTHGLLADEYTYGPPACGLFEPSAANATMQTARAQIKWSAWIDGLTPIPTFSTQTGVPGLYQGAMYCESGMYRPTSSSKMRSLGSPFEQVNDEQMVRRLYNYISTIDAFSPTESELSVPKGVSQTFTITPMLPAQHALSVSWIVDDLTVASGNSFTLNTGLLTTASHRVQAVVRDSSVWVRSDPLSLTTDSHTWTVQVSELNDSTMSVSPNALVFGNTFVGESSPGATSITLANTGTSVLTIRKIAVTGADADQFTLTTTCGAFPVNMAAGEQCTVTPSFMPTRTGNLSAFVSISNNAGDAGLISLTGTGTDFVINASAPTTGPIVGVTVDLVAMGAPTFYDTTFTATGNPAGTTVTFDPSTIPAGSESGSVLMTISSVTPVASTMEFPGRNAPYWPYTLALPMALMGTMAGVSVKRGRSVIPVAHRRPFHVFSKWLALLLFAGLSVAACSGGGTGGSSSSPNPSGSYMVTVTATSGPVSRSTEIRVPAR